MADKRAEKIRAQLRLRRCHVNFKDGDECCERYVAALAALDSLERELEANTYTSAANELEKVLDLMRAGLAETGGGS